MRAPKRGLMGLFVLTLALVPVLGGTALLAEQDGTETREQAAEEVESGQPEVAVEKTTDDVTTERRKQLVREAMTALEKTREALAALEDGDGEAALESLAIATGKLELLVARNPSMAMAPVDVQLVTYDIYGTVEEIERARKEALKLLKDGRVQDARVIMEGLRSDLVVELVNVPLATYPEAIKAVSPLIDRGEIEAARLQLQQALNTLVVTEQIHPLPLLRTRHMLGRAEELAETEGRTEDQNEELSRLLDACREELKFAQALGYGEKGDFEAFYEQLDAIARKTREGRSGAGFFDEILRSLRSLAGSSEEGAAG